MSDVYNYKVESKTGYKTSGSVNAKDRQEAEKKVRDRHKNDLKTIISLEKQ